MKPKLLLSLSICLLILTANAQDKDISKTAAQLIITPENPLPVRDSALRDAVVKWSVKQLREKDYRKVKIQPSSAIFPGKEHILTLLWLVLGDYTNGKKNNE